MEEHSINSNENSKKRAIPLRVVIVEDTPADAETMVRNLTRKGFQVDWQRVENKIDYLKALESPCDLILSDWSLSQFSGLAALQLMQQRGLDIPFIIVSGGIGEETAVAMMQQGAADYVLKDRMGRLGQIVKNTLEQYQLKSENKKAVEALAASEAELRALFSAMHDVVLVLDREGFYRKIAPTNPDLLFKPAQELLGSRLEDVFPPEQAREFSLTIQKVLETQQTQYIEYELFIQNRSIWFETSVSPISEQKVIWVARDVTERKQAEAQLRLQAAALSSAANAILITDRNGTIEWANAAFGILTGYSVEETIGKNPRDLVKSGHQDQAFYQKMWDTILAGEVWRGELTNRRKDGELYWEKLTITPLISQEGQVTQLVAIKEDISQQRQNEDIMKTRLRLHEFSITHTLNELLQATLDEIENLTGSLVGFFHYLSADQQTLSLQEWSTRTKEVFCKAEGAGFHYNIAEAGVWVDCVYERKPVIHNQFAALPHRKGMPPGHVEITRELVVPVIRNNKIVAILGVGNKESDYTERDAQIASRLADLAWDITEIKVSNKSLQRHLQRQEQIAALGRKLANVRDLTAICRIARGFLKQMTDSVYFSVALMNPENYSLRTIYSSWGDIELDVSFYPLLELDRKHPTSEYSLAIATQRPIIVNDPVKISSGLTDLHHPNLQSTRSACYLPLSADDQTIGVIELQSLREHEYQPEDLEWLSVVANQVGLSIQNGQLFAETQQRIAELTTLAVIDSAVIEHLGPDETYEIVLNEVRSSLNVDAAVLYLYQAHSQILECVCESGYNNRVVLPQSLQLGESLAGKVAHDQQILYFNFDDKSSINLLKNLPNSERFKDYYGVPLVADSQLIGVLEVLHRSRIAPDSNWLRFLKIIADQTAVAIKTIQLYKNVQDANNELLRAYDLTIQGWSRAMDLRDEETENHTRRVTDLTVRLAQRLGISDEQILSIQRGALLHDIGKLGIPDRILSKECDLTEEEWSIMRQHPQFAYEMLFPIEYLHPSLDIPFCHHEKWDGSGYPHGLKGEQIPLAARLFALVDVYDALTSDRPYRKAWSHEQAVNYIREQSGSHFDPKLVNVFLSLLESGDFGKKP